MRQVMKVLGVGCLAAAIFLGSVFVAKADEDNRGQGGGNEASKILKMKEKLGLTDDQVSKLQTMAAAEKAEVGPLVKQSLTDLKALGDKLKAGGKDEDFKPLLDALDADRHNVEAAKDKYIGQARTILTPTQQAKVVIGMTMKRMMMMKKWKGEGDDQGGDDR